MPITVNCPTCNRALRVPDELLGKRVKCPACATVLTASAEGVKPAGPPPQGEEVVRRKRPPEPEEEDEEEPVRPVRRKAVTPPSEEGEEEEPSEEEEYEERQREPKRSRQKKDKEKYCQECGAIILAKAVTCPKCGVAQGGIDSDEGPYADISSKKIAAGICGILVGSLGIHKFILGMTTEGVIMLLVSVLTCGVGGIVMGVIGIVEGIIYLAATNEKFYRTYVIQKKGWF